MTQNNVINIQLEESYQEFQLGTELFRVGLGDEMRRKWIEADEKYKKKLEKLNKY
ncbi:TPA: phage tail assembly chaperone, partial [Listeria monocytogenes]|nr:phage tail assembly chaperone [Listeria monocytogenes]